MILSALTIVDAESQSIIRTQDLQLYVGDSLIISSDQTSIQRVLLQGNVTSVGVMKRVQYPTNRFEFTSLNPGIYDLRVLFDLQSDYRVNLYAQLSNQTRMMNSTSYYLSSGQSELDVKASFLARPSIPSVAMASESPWASFANWIGKFGEAFPIWVKLLYMVLGIQFFAVGGLWLHRETTRRESSPQRLDIGDKAFLWLDIAYRFFLSSLAAIVLIMGGELLILFILRFMFLVSLSLLSLWDLFVVGFAAGAVILVYVIRLGCEKILDMKPIEDE
jgi:hypothetical protein